MVRNCCTVDSVTTYYVTSTRRFPPRLGLFLLQLLDRNRQHPPIHFTIEEQEEEEEEEKEGEEGKKKRSSHFDLWILRVPIRATYSDISNNEFARRRIVRPRRKRIGERSRQEIETE